MVVDGELLCSLAAGIDQPQAMCFASLKLERCKSCVMRAGCAICDEAAVISTVDQIIIR